MTKPSKFSKKIVKLIFMSIRLIYLPILKSSVIFLFNFYIGSSFNVFKGLMIFPLNLEIKETYLFIKKKNMRKLKLLLSFEILSKFMKL